MEAEPVRQLLLGRLSTWSLVTPAAATAAATKTPKAAKPDGKHSQLDAEVKVLAEAGTPMNTKGYWTSHGGATPAQTLYSALIREISQKWNASRSLERRWAQDSLRNGTRV